MLKTNEYHVTLVSKDSLDVNLFGKVRTEVSLEQIAKYHGRSGFLRRIVNAIRFYWVSIRRYLNQSWAYIYRVVRAFELLKIENYIIPYSIRIRGTTHKFNSQ